MTARRPVAMLLAAVSVLLCGFGSAAQGALLLYEGRLRRPAEGYPGNPRDKGGP